MMINTRNIQKKDSFKFSFFFPSTKSIYPYIPLSIHSKNSVFLFGRWLSNNYQLFIYRPRGAVQRIKPDSRPLDARRGCPPPPSLQRTIECAVNLAAPIKLERARRENGLMDRSDPFILLQGVGGREREKKEKKKGEGERGEKNLIARRAINFQHCR